MLGSAPATASLQTASATQLTPSRPPESDRRPSRLRGLSYLRNYTSSHLHSSRAADSTPHLNRSISSPGITNHASPVPPTPTLTRIRTTIRQANQSINTEERHETEEERERENTASPARIESGENGWIPTIQGRSGLSRDSLHPTTTSTALASSEPNNTAAMMTRNRSMTAVASGPTPTTTAPTSQRRPSAFDPTSPDAMPESSTASAPPSKELPTIRFIPHVETRSSRPSLNFSALSRTLKTPNSVVRVGRYSERDSTSHEPNTLPVGFKSKVVSRRHCEFWCTDGQWYIRDVKSSSGTFLNHVRLCSPGQESRPFPVNDGDVVQLGIDFKGGEEIIFRCVKIRVECNRGWQKSLNSFNTTTHKRLLKNTLNAKTRDSDAASVNSSECSICLNAVAPCQALFVAPCSHVWHYKCIRNLIHSPQWPNFVCPNCRYVADLEADVESPEDNDLEIDTAPRESQALEEDRASRGDAARNRNEDTLQLPTITPQRRSASSSRQQEVDDDLAALLSETALGSPLHQTEQLWQTEPATSNETQPIRIAQSTSSTRKPVDPIGARSMTPTTHTQFALATGPMVEGPLTPRNDAGPFVLDGSGGHEPDGDNEAVTESSGARFRRDEGP